MCGNEGDGGGGDARSRRFIPTIICENEQGILSSI